MKLRTSIINNLHLEIVILEQGKRKVCKNQLYIQSESHSIQMFQQSKITSTELMHRYLGGPKGYHRKMHILSSLPQTHSIPA
jgi:hypothetical protein